MKSFDENKILMKFSVKVFVLDKEYSDYPIFDLKIVYIIQCYRKLPLDALRVLIYRYIRTINIIVIYEETKKINLEIYWEQMIIFILTICNQYFNDYLFFMNYLLNLITIRRLFYHKIPLKWMTFVPHSRLRLKH